MKNKIFIIMVSDLQNILDNNSILNFRKTYIVDSEEELTKELLHLLKKEKCKNEYCALNVSIKQSIKELENNDRKIIHKNFFKDMEKNIENVYFLYKNNKINEVELIKFNFKEQLKYVQSIINKKISI